ncbi:lysostaphin resistance A-like protein [Enterobacteriaceae bacterium TYF_5]
MEFPKDRIYHSFICVLAFIGYFFSSFSLLLTPAPAALFQSPYIISLISFFIYLPYCLIIWFAYQKHIKLMPLGRLQWSTLKAPFLALVGLYFISLFLGTEDDSWVTEIESITGFAFFLFALSVIFIAPITEEIIFRGFLLNAGMWYGNIGKWVAIIISSLLFAAMHTQYESITTFILIFVVGVVFCQIRIGTRSLIAPIVLHGIHNTISIVFLML